MEKDLATPEQIRDYCLEWLRENKDVLNIHGLSAKISDGQKPIPNFLQMVYGHRKLKSKYIMPLYGYLITCHGLKPLNESILSEPERVEEAKPETKIVLEEASYDQEIWKKRLIFSPHGHSGFSIIGFGFEYLQDGKNVEVMLQKSPVFFNLELTQSAEKAAKALKDLLTKIQK